MTWSWAMAPIVIAGLALALAPWIAKIWVDVETRCPACGRELLLGDPMRHRPQDVEFCQFVIRSGWKG